MARVGNQTNNRLKMAMLVCCAAVIMCPLFSVDTWAQGGNILFGDKNSKISHHLLRLHNDYTIHIQTKSPVTYEPIEQAIRVYDGSVVIDATAAGDAAMLVVALEALGLRSPSVVGRMVSGVFPIESIPELDNVAELNYVRPALCAVGTGSVTSQGDTALLAEMARDDFGVDGNGLTLGTLSDSYDCLGGAPGDVATNDLPGGVTVLQELAPCNGTDEGRAMMQIIHDLAPGCDQAFHSAFLGQADFAGGIVELATVANCDIICDDVFYFAEPFFQDGVIAQAVDQVVGMGVPYFSLAGNHGRESYEAIYRASGTTPPNLPASCGSADAHDFDPGPGVDIYQQITIPGNTRIRFSFQWDQPFFAVSGAPGCQNDMDIYIFDDPPTTPLAGSADNNIGNDAVEVFTITNGGVVARNYNVVLVHCDPAGTPAPGRIKYIVLVNGNVGGFTPNEWGTQSSTIYGHMNSALGTAVGAAFYADTPEYGTSPPVQEDFSSAGNTPILFDIAGNPANIVRDRPHFCAVDGVNNTFFGWEDTENDGWLNFFGTSAAAPHAAAVAALLMEAVPGLTPAQVYTALENSAIDMDVPGYDNDTGWGLIQATGAICEFDTDPPDITCPADLVLECNNGNSGVDGDDPMILAWLASVTADDECGPPMVTNNAPTTFPLGETTVTFTAEDDAGNVSSCTAKVTVEDTTAPSITCPGDVTVECSDFCGTPWDDPQLSAFFAGVSASDVCCAVNVTNDAPACFPLGTTTVTFTATDCVGNADSCTADVTVEDTTPPEITVTLNRDRLWPPNHKMVDIYATVEVTDVCCEFPTFVLTSATSDEPDNGKGDGNTINDIQDADIGTADTHIKLRSERQGGGDGRVYTIVYTASDCVGNTTDATVEVHVPHDHSGWAFASMGFAASGVEFEPGAKQIVLVIPSKEAEHEVDLNGQEILTAEAFDATALELTRVYVGNTKSVVVPERSLEVDNNTDGLTDVAVYYAVKPINSILGSSEGIDGPIGLHYVSEHGTDYLVPDIFALGEPVPVIPVIEIPRERAGAAEEPGNDTPSVTALRSAYPNPFNPSTTIPFTLVNQERVLLRIYDARGKLVRLLKNDVMPAGSHEVVWDGRDNSGNQMATGVYFVRFVAGSYEMTKKVVMLK
ncbi:MAG: HYR domain-containing protein [Candidatus Latescibacterota bacterium]|nr:MAG: HYR domain-containing protein [Candidatus Latescibacterota bacterium]